VRRVSSLLVVVSFGVCAALAGCSGDDDATATAGTATTRPAVTTTTLAPRYTAHVTNETVVDPVYRQGLARLPHGWAFSVNDGLFITDDSLRQTLKRAPVIPAAWRARGFDHIGDIDVVGNVLYAPLEQPDFAQGHQAVLTFDATTLAYTGSVDLAQHQASFITVDGATGIACSTDRFGGRALTRYDVTHHWRPLPPLHMSQFVDQIQGADLYGGAIWLSTDDKTDGLYRVDLHTGEVQSLGSMGHADGEGEGIDATPVGGADLRTLSIDVKLAPVRLVALTVEASPR
jgi:hypothetical protein